MNGSIYRKLPGHGTTWMGASRMWLGDDHVLLVNGRTFTEVYRRFFLRDIQAVIVQRTKVGMLWNGINGGIAGFFGLMAAIVQDPGGQIFLAIAAAPFAVALFVNLLRGPTCRCFIQTAVQTEPVPALSRVRTVRAFLQQVEPLIVAAQGAAPSTAPAPVAPVSASEEPPSA